MPTLADTLNTALQHHRAGRLQEAESLYLQILRTQPNHPDALHLLGLIAHHVGRHADAVDLIVKAIAIKPTVAEFHNNLGETYHALNRMEDAVACYERALSLKPDYAQAHSNLGAALHGKGKHMEAAAHCRRALECQPDCVNAYYNLALIQQDLGLLDDAVSNYRRAVALVPAFVEACCNLGAALQAQGKLDEAVFHYQQALLVRPACAEAHHNLGSAFSEQGNVELSTRHYQEALRLKPDKTLWRLTMDSVAPVILSDRAEARRWHEQFERAVESYAPIDLESSVADVSASSPYPSFYAAYQGYDECPVRTKFARLFRSTRGRAIRSRPTGRPRIGFVVTASHEAAFLNLTRGIINTVAQDLRPTIVCTSGAVERIRSGLDVEVDVLGVPRSFPSAVEAVKEARFDLLYYWEIGTDATNYFLPFLGLAPVQCTSWGFPVTTGIPRVDYFISSTSLEPAGAKAHYSETLVLLDALPAYYYRPVLRSPLKDRADFGLPERGTLYSCLQSLFKFHPDFDETIGGILRADRTGHLLLIEGPQRQWTDLLLRRFRRTIPDVLDRVRFLPRQSAEDFLHLQAIADVILDALHWSGNNTTHDALAFGTPIVTLPSEFMRGRVTYGCYKQIGVMDCVASNKEEYVALAVRLGTDRDYRRMVKEKILASNGALYENAGVVRELERFFVQAVEAVSGSL